MTASRPKPEQVKLGQKWRGPNPYMRDAQAATVMASLPPQVLVVFDRDGIALTVSEADLRSDEWQFLSDPAD